MRIRKKPIKKFRSGKVTKPLPLVCTKEMPGFRVEEGGKKCIALAYECGRCMSKWRRKNELRQTIQEHDHAGTG